MLKGVGLRDMFCKKVVVVNFRQAVLRMASEVTYNDTAPLQEVAFFFVQQTSELHWSIKPFYNYVFPQTNRNLGKRYMLSASHGKSFYTQQPHD